MNRHRVAAASSIAAIVAAGSLGVFTGGHLNGQPVPLVEGAPSLSMFAAAAVAALFALSLPGWPIAAASLLVLSSGVLAALLLNQLHNGIAFDATATVPLVLVLIIGLACWGLSKYARDRGRFSDLLVPAVFAVLILFLWETITVGYRIPGILLPSPSAIGRAISAYSYDLTQDFLQTVVREAVPGFLIGSAAGIAMAFAADRSPFLQAGLLPIGNWVGVMPIVGIAPIMVMWFGFGWESKAAVVVLMTFFPTLVTTLAGLRVASPLEYDLMASYSASYRQTLLKFRVPAAMPFIISALKLNASLALIGSIVAEFFGTPTYGLGFRISTEVGRLNLDRVWAAIAIAAVTGAASYGALGLAERTITFWHPSQRPRGRI